MAGVDYNVLSYFTNNEDEDWANSGLLNNMKKKSILNLILRANNEKNMECQKWKIVQDFVFKES